jgi:predicted Fe-Mo cluster-binding NifX family protein
MIVCVPVTGTGQIDPRWGRADRIAVANVEDGQIATWEEFDVGWNQLHDEGTEGSHHARVARFLLEHDVEAVVAGHMGSPMVGTLKKLGIQVQLGASDDARAAVCGAGVTNAV